MAMKIVPPHAKIKERITAFGMDGCGKSSLILQILEQHKDATAHIVDLDYSQALQRLVYLEHPDVEDRTNIIECPAIWTPFAEAMQRIINTGDMENDWLVIDPATVTWQMVQSWYSEMVHGSDISDHMIKLRKETAGEADPIKAFNKELSTDMTWQIINKQYSEKFYNLFRQWRGHSILVCEATTVRRDAAPEERREFGFIGAKPKGQNSIGYVGATNVYLEHPDQKKWTYTTTKDRGRELQLRVPFDDFATDYLVNVADWEWVKA